MGTTFKVEGKLENLTDYYRVKDFMVRVVIQNFSKTIVVQFVFEVIG